MDFFAPENLPGVGMGDLASVVGICGMLGLAVTSGLLVAEGLIGTIVFVAGAIAVLTEKTDMGGAQATTWAVLAALVLLAIARVVLARLARAGAEDLKGAAADAPQTKARRAGVARMERSNQLLALLGVALAGAATGFAWAEWNEVPFRLGDVESIAGLVAGLLAAAIGGDAAWRFLRGAIRAGGSAIVIGIVLCIVALIANALSVYVPVVGAVVLLAALLLALRLRRREQRKFAGLRILS